MKYIQKKDSPQFFIDDTIGLTNWNQYWSTKKKKLKTYILDNEQFGLCCYCEKEITAETTSSHVEHVIPKMINLDTLTFNYSNLLVSCEGNHFNELGDISKNTCGQIKNNNFDVHKFLNPTLIKNISEYFVFDRDSGIISSSSIDRVKADYTYQILNLNGNNSKLAEARKIAKESLVRNLSTLPIELRKTKLREFLNNDSKEFITFFRYIFKNFIN